MMEDPVASLKKFYKATEFQESQAKNLSSLYNNNVGALGVQMQQMAKENAALKEQVNVLSVYAFTNIFIVFKLCLFNPWHEFYWS